MQLVVSSLRQLSLLSLAKLGYPLTCDSPPCTAVRSLACTDDRTPCQIGDAVTVDRQADSYISYQLKNRESGNIYMQFHQE